MKGFLTLILILFAASSHAEYIAKGKITGQECTSYIIVDSCKNRQIDAVKGDDGRLYSVKRRYQSVNEYRGGRCWVHIKSRGMGLISNAINVFAGSQFYEKQPDGTYEEVDPEYITFKCKKR